ncbi:unnamed protein product, partial [Didymodactylos carnosus]
PLQLLFGTEESQLLMQEMYLIFTETTINSVSLGITKHLNEQIHKQKEDDDDNLLYVLKILEVDGGTGGSTVPF